MVVGSELNSMQGKRGRGGGDEGRLGRHPFPLLRLPGAWSHTTRFRVDGIKAMSRGINVLKYNSHLPTIGLLQLAIHVVKMAMMESKSHTGIKTNKGNYHLKLCIFSCLSCPRATFALSSPHPPSPPAS